MTDTVIDYRARLMDRACSEPGCAAEHTIACEEPRSWLEAEIEAAVSDERGVTWYCPEHAEANGFCRGCGLFCAGMETFDVGPRAGYCANCWDQIEADTRDRTDPCDDNEGEYPW